MTSPVAVPMDIKVKTVLGFGVNLGLKSWVLIIKWLLEVKFKFFYSSIFFDISYVSHPNLKFKYVLGFCQNNVGEESIEMP